LIHAGANARLRAGVQYVFVQPAWDQRCSSLPLGAIYCRKTGTLNTADLAIAVSN